MDQVECQKIIESLRLGIPPEGYTHLLTVGRKKEINQLLKILSEDAKSYLVEANYGAGKTHLLKFIKEKALELNYVTSLISLDSKSNARFNRMDQIFGQICRNIQVPKNNQKSIRYLFDSLFDPNNQKSIKEDLDKISNYDKWNENNFFKSEAIYISIRAWKVSYENGHNMSPKIDNLIEDWLFNPFNYYNQRKYLYTELIAKLKKWFKDPRPEYKFYDRNEGIFNFQIKGYSQSWDALHDLHKISLAAGFKGLILLIDEFEDVIYNLRNINYQQDAFWNLFEFFFKKRFPGIAFFAVTPNFIENCKRLLYSKDIFDENYLTKFDMLETIKLSPLTSEELLKLSEKIISIYSNAYQWNINSEVKKKIKEICIESSNIAIEDRVRQTIKEIITILDQEMSKSS